MTQKRVDRSKQPKIKEFNNFPLQKANTYTLNNGLKLHTLNAGQQPVIKIELISGAGEWHAPKKGLSSVSASMLKEGTQQRSAYELSAFAEKYGAFYEINTTPDFLNFSLVTLARYYKNLLPLIFEIFTEPAFPEKEFNNLKNRTLQNLSLNLQKTNFLAGQIAKEQIFGHTHPYGKPLSKEIINSIELQECIGFYKNCIRKNFSDIFLSGCIDDQIIRYTQDYFEKLAPIKPDTISPDTTETNTQPGQIRRKIEEKPQSSIRIGRNLFTKHHEDFFRVILLNEVLGGYFGSKLMKNLREEKGYTYGISSQVIPLVQHGYWIIGTDVGKAYTQSAIDEIYQEIENLKNEKVNQEELEYARKSILSNHLNSIATPFQLMDKFKNIYLYGLDYTFYDNFVNQIKHITADELLETARKYLNPDQITEIAVGGLE